MPDLDQLLGFLGRLHPVVLHVPIGVLIALGVCEGWCRLRRAPLDRGLRVLLITLALGSALLTGVSGWLLAEEPAYGASRTLTLHRWLGVALVCLTGVAWLAAVARRGRLYAGSLLGALIVLGPVGHFGGVMTHGPTFLTQPFRSTGPSTPPVELSDGAITYDIHIAPFLETYCAACHGVNRQRGGLAVHTREALFAGGDYGPVVFAGDPDNSELLTRMLMPLDDELRMPPAERAQPSQREIEMVARWIREGAQ
jgi:uncharacterized membrane protein